MTILRGGGGSTNNMYVATSAARQKPRIQTQAVSGCLPWPRGRGGATLGRDEGTTHSPECRDNHGRPGGRSQARRNAGLSRDIIHETGRREWVVHSDPRSFLQNAANYD